MILKISTIGYWRRLSSELITTEEIKIRGRNGTARILLWLLSELISLNGTSLESARDSWSPTGWSLRKFLWRQHGSKICMLLTQIRIEHMRALQMMKAWIELESRKKNKKWKKKKFQVTMMLA